MLKQLSQTIIGMPDFRGKRRALRFLLKQLDGCTIRSRYGPTLRLRADDYTNQCAIIGMDHIDTDDVFREVDSMQSGMAFIDIGANAGLFSMVAGRRTGTTGVVVAFEPSLRIFRDLVDNAMMNKLPSFHPFNVAIGSSTCLARFASGDESHSGIGHLDEQGGTSVLQIRADDFGEILDKVVGERRCVVKIDVEGAEEIVVDSISNWLRRSRVTKLIAEIDSRYLERFDNSAASLYEKLEALGFKARRGLGTAKHYNEVFERSATGV